MNSIVYALIAFPILYALERGIHYYLMLMTYLMLRQRKAAFYMYAVILLPGVFLHELSHWVMANLLWVPTYRFSVRPRLFDDGTFVLGYVESSTRSRNGVPVGPVRWTLIGVAPLLFGIAAILMIGFFVFDIGQVQLAVMSEGNFTAALDAIFETPYWGIWLYLLFAISNAMMPSKPDRQAWPTFFVIVFVIVLSLYAMGVLEEIWISMAPLIIATSTYLGVAFSITIIVNLFFLAVLFVLIRFLKIWRV